MEPDPVSPLRVAVVSPDPARRTALAEQLRGTPGVEVRAWAEQVENLLLLGTRLDAVLCTEPPPQEAAWRLRERGGAVVVLPPGANPAAALAGAAPATRTTLPRPHLADRQQQVLVAYASGNELLPTIARRLGMERETLKTHLRRIRTKYAEVGRPAPTRRDLYVRAVEDGLLPPPRS